MQRKYLLFVLLLINAQLFGQTFHSIVQGLWNPEGARNAEKIVIQKESYLGSRFLSVFISNNEHSEITILVTGFFGIVKTITGNYPDYVLEVQRARGNGEQIVGQKGVMIIHFLNENTIWFEEKFSEELAEEVFGGAWIEFGFSNKYIRSKVIKK
jgi:hypothetical protein